MNSQFREFLRGQTAAATDFPTWQWREQPVPLHQQTFICPVLPPDELISSARAILFQGDAVMVIRDHNNDPYIVPGGRREPGETVLETLHREVQEETGWSLRETAVLGFVHFQHLTAKPRGYPYPYPHFMQAIFTAWAGCYDASVFEEDFYVTSSSFLPVETVLAWRLSSGQAELLRAALLQIQE